MALAGSPAIVPVGVSVVSTLQTQPPMIADELRRQADQFIDLADLEIQVGRKGQARANYEDEEVTIPSKNRKVSIERASARRSERL